MKAGPNFLQYRFHRRLEWREGEDGRTVVFRPRFGESRIGKWLESLLGLAPYRIRLDEMGTMVWKQCDGKVSAQEIVKKLRDKFGDKIEPAEDRLEHFIAQMIRARMIQVSLSDRSPTPQPSVHSTKREKNVA